MKVILQGYRGKMGKEIFSYLENQGVNVIGVDEEHPLSLYENEKGVDFLIDFSSIEGTYEIVKFALSHQLPLLIGTTGIQEETIKEWDKLAKEKKLTMVLLENYLLSIFYLKQFLRKVDSLFPQIEMEETHHQSKKDCPSGTALLLRRSFSSQKKIPILSKRVTIYTYEHKIILKNEDETIEIVHRTFHKRAYAKGLYEILTHWNDYQNEYGVIRERKDASGKGDISLFK